LASGGIVSVTSSSRLPVREFVAMILQLEKESMQKRRRKKGRSKRVISSVLVPSSLCSQSLRGHTHGGKPLRKRLHKVRLDSEFFGKRVEAIRIFQIVCSAKESRNSLLAMHAGRGGRGRITPERRGVDQRHQFDMLLFGEY
jgi:hypothetical protein